MFQPINGLQNHLKHYLLMVLYKVLNNFQNYFKNICTILLVATDLQTETGVENQLNTNFKQNHLLTTQHAFYGIIQTTHVASSVNPILDKVIYELLIKPNTCGSLAWLVR